MKNIVILLMILSFVSCDKKGLSEKVNTKDQQTNQYISRKDTINGDEYVFYLKKQNPTSSKNVYYKLDSIVIFKKNTRYVLNLLNKKKLLPEYAITNGIYTNYDYNFDGVNDIMLYPHRENHSVYSVQYFADYFLFNKKNNCFEDNPQLDSMPNVEICKKGKFLTSNDGSSYLKKYQWKRDSLKLVGNIQVTELVGHKRYKINIHDIEKDKKKEYFSKEKDFSYFKCK